MPNGKIDPSQVPGWGVDASTANDPTFPMRRRKENERRGYTWTRPPQQPATVEVLHSNERPNLSSVFGTVTPPSAVSGMLRRFAFRYSESDYRHWLPLMLADRVNMVEGVLDDISHGHLPNIPKELGWGAEWKHNRKGLLTRLGVYALLGFAAIGWLTRDEDKD